MPRHKNGAFSSLSVSRFYRGSQSHRPSLDSTRLWPIKLPSQAIISAKYVYAPVRKPWFSYLTIYKLCIALCAQTAVNLVNRPASNSLRCFPNHRVGERFWQRRHLGNHAKAVALVESAAGIGGCFEENGGGLDVDKREAVTQQRGANALPAYVWRGGDVVEVPVRAVGLIQVNGFLMLGPTEFGGQTTPNQATQGFLPWSPATKAILKGKS